MSSYIIPTSSTFLTELSDRTIFRYYRLKINGVDITDKIFNFSLTGGQQKTYAQWSATLKNKDRSLSAGDYADEPCTIEVKTETSLYYTIFTGYVSEAGLTRERGRTNDDYVKITMYDRQKSRGIKRKPDPAILAGFKVCNPSSISSSIFHYLAALTGVSAYDTSLIDFIIPITEVGSNAAWTELKKLADLYKADMYYRYDGALRFFSPFETSYSTPASEWTFIADASVEQGNTESSVHGKLATSKRAIEANRCTVEFNEYTHLDTQVIYENIENYDSDSGYIDIEISPGEYWPGDGSGDYAALKYQDQDTGEAFDYATDIVTPTIGAVGSGSDIEYTGGTLVLVSFNGSTSATKQQANASEIILQNSSVDICRIRKFQLRGKPYRCDKENTVQDIDPAVTSEEEYVDKNLDGTFASTVAQAQSACIRTVEHGKDNRGLFAFTADWCPVLQRGTVCTLKEAGESDVTIKVLSFVHKNTGEKKTQFSTQIEAEIFDDSTTSRTVATGSTTVSDPAKKTAEDTASAIAVRPTYSELQDGYDDATSGGTTTPSIPTISACEPVGIGGIKLLWDNQPLLTNFARYEIVGSEDCEELSGTFVSGDATVTGTDTSGMTVGDEIQGDNIPSGTTVASITSGTEFEMSADAIGTGTAFYLLVPATANWYALKNDGTDWKDTSASDTDVLILFYVHSDIPFGGTTEDPTGFQLFYKVRRVTKAALSSAWSAVATATTSLISNGSVAAGTLTANKTDTGFLQACFAAISELAAGYDGSGSYSAPSEGDQGADDKRCADISAELFGRELVRREKIIFRNDSRTLTVTAYRLPGCRTSAGRHQ